MPIAEVESIAHGTTLVTNAVIERRGANTGMLVTAGFRDILDMGFEQRYDLFDLRLTWPDPLVPRRLRREVPERVGHDGQVVTPLDPESTRAAVRDLVDSRRHRGARHLLPALVRQPRARGGRGRAGALRVPRPARVALGRGVREHARVRALDHGDDERLRPADVRPLHRAARTRARGPRLRRATVRDDVVRGVDRAGDGAALSGAGAGIRPRRRRADVGPPRTHPRVPRPAVVRHGRDHREGRAGARLHRAQAATTWRSGGSTSSRAGADSR